tara:strand:+ start:893 stop:1354 length:462 start_codon:yes stop_codon:yes gene_type:complete
MSVVTFTGPIKAGDVLNTTGTTAGTVKNVGFVMMAQTYPLTQAGTYSASSVGTATTIVIPANSHIVQIQMLATVAWASSGTISIGTTTAATQLVAATAISAIGITGLTPGTDATRTALWSNTGTSDVILYVLSSQNAAGTGDLVVRYIQAENA